MSQYNGSYGGSESGGSTSASTNLLTSNGNLASTTVTANPSAFVTASITQPFMEPAQGYAVDFVAATNNTVEMSYEGTTARDFRLDFSGTIVATDPAFLDTYIGIRITTDLGQVFTGGTKFYPVGVSFGGATPAIGFAITVYGNFQPDEVVQFQVSSNTAGDLVVTDVLAFTGGIKPIA